MSKFTRKGIMLAVTGIFLSTTLLAGCGGGDKKAAAPAGGADKKIVIKYYEYRFTKKKCTFQPA